MATLSSGGKEYQIAYDGADLEEIGLGLITPNIYASPDYQKKKIKTLAIGLLSDVVYAGFEHDHMPLILPIVQEPRYGTILAYNLHYVPVEYRQAIMKYVIDSNRARIKSNLPIIIDYHSLKRAIPQSASIVRRYKQVGVGVVETYALEDIPEVIRKPSRWENHYKQLQG